MIGDSYTSDIQGGTKMEIKSILVRSENKNNYRNYCKDLENKKNRLKAFLNLLYTTQR
jgi:ribonucleotide monophosphatase NagD (HAD superfamily)